MKFLKILWERLVLQATLPEIKLALSSKSRDLLSHVISECMQMRGRIDLTRMLLYKVRVIIRGLHDKLRNFSNKIKSRFKKMKIRNSAQKHSKEKTGWVGEVGKRHKMMT